MYNFAITKKMNQITRNIMMIEPVSFNFNAETALNNYYQKNDSSLSESQVQIKALAEFNNFVSLLRSKKINVHVIKDTIDPLRDLPFFNKFSIAKSRQHDRTFAFGLLFFSDKCSNETTIAKNSHKESHLR